MNSEFLKHLQSITPQGMAAEKRLFIPADVIKKEVEDADELRRLDSIDELDEAAPDIGQNLKGMPRLSARKLAYALKKGGDRSKELDRHTRKMRSNARRWGNRLDSAMSDFSKRTGIPMKESSLSMRKGIRLGVAVDEKGHTHLGHRNDAALLRALSKIRKDAGLDPRITVIPPKYKPSDAEYAVMQDHARKRREGINKKYGIDESAKKTYKRIKKTAKRVIKKLYQVLSTPQDAVDVLYTGRIF